MTRLQQELQRLYLLLPPDTGASPAPAGGFHLVAADGRVRAMVLELREPADWGALSRVWQGVQADLDLPAPGIAVSGQDGYQLWFSLAIPVPASQAAAFLEALRLRYLAEVKPWRLRMAPAAAGAGDAGWQPPAVPAAQADDEHWSAFVSQDLAPMFAETPWLDTPPNPDGQAGLLATLRCTTPAAFQRALQACGLVATAQPPPPAAAPAPAAAGAQQDPRQFLLAVMNDGSAPLALRIEAAKALLPGVDQVPQKVR